MNKDIIIIKGVSSQKGLHTCHHRRDLTNGTQKIKRIFELQLNDPLKCQENSNLSSKRTLLA